jgi:hypothetical protein
MKYPAILVSVVSIFAITLSFISCDKRPFAQVELHGRGLDSINGPPFKGTVSLWVGASSPGSKGTTNYGTTHTNADGTFDIKSNAQWNGDEYVLEFIPGDPLLSSGGEKSFHVNKGQNLNVGDIILPR